MPCSLFSDLSCKINIGMRLDQSSPCLREMIERSIILIPHSNPFHFQPSEKSLTISGRWKLILVSALSLIKESFWLGRRTLREVFQMSSAEKDQTEYFCKRSVISLMCLAVIELEKGDDDWWRMSTKSIIFHCCASWDS